MIYSLAASRGASWLGLWLLLGALSPKSRSDARVHDSSRLPPASRSGTKKGIGMPWLIALPAAHGESDSLRPPVRPSHHRPCGVSRGRTDDGCSQLVNPDATRVRDRSVRTDARIFCSASWARTDGTNGRDGWTNGPRAPGLACVHPGCRRTSGTASCPLHAHGATRTSGVRCDRRGACACRWVNGSRGAHTPRSATPEVALDWTRCERSPAPYFGVL